eukprot:TRINITY_DN3598_c0_g1_i1.p1 TRINITY_DN3598_c0_g1~~TRINITY_DN3598_c0_g1_i1.p1  ORF type:complete len:192 (+),score=19.60 TRINITY_DN3598_c0_g1_i1:445-1020(+)
MDQINALNSKEATLLKALLIRSCFGGMKGDMKMLQDYVALWYHRFSEMSVPQHFNPGNHKNWILWLESVYQGVTAPLIDFTKVDPLDYNDCLVDAIDYHCSDQVKHILEDSEARQYIDDFAKKTDSDAELLLKKIIWNFRSGINVKTFIIVPSYLDGLAKDLKPLRSVFRSIRPYLDKFAASCYKKQFRRY